MKKEILSLLILFILIIPFTVADGGLIIYDKDMWRMFDEDKQYAAINYKDGLQNMIVSVDTAGEIEGDKAVWIIPVPAKPEETVINIIKGFPELRGYDVEREAKSTIEDSFNMMRLLQFYSIGLFWSTSGGGFLQDIGAKRAGITIHEHVEKMGLTTELVSATDSLSFTDYLESKDLDIPPDFKSILYEYIGEEYCFVISWISDVEQFIEEQKVEREKYYYSSIGNTVAVFTTFPTDDLFYPLKPTSVYGSTRVPVVIYVMDYVEPELYSTIKADSSVNYFYENYYRPPDGLREFFFNQDEIRNLRYTKISIDPPSKYLTQDLWIKRVAPSRIRVAELVSRYSTWLFFVCLVLCSCLASLIAGMIVFRDGLVSKTKLLLLGLSNLFTFLGFIVTTYLTTMDSSKKTILEFIHRDGSRIFKDQKKMYLLALQISFSITLVWFIISRFVPEWVGVVLIIFSILGIIHAIFRLSKEHIREEFLSNMMLGENFAYVSDSKKFFTLLFVNIVATLWMLGSHYQGFRHWLGFDANGFHVLPLIILSVFTLSILIVFIIEVISKRLNTSRGISIVYKDHRKFWFVIGFIGIFIFLTIVLQYLLNFLV